MLEFSVFVILIPECYIWAHFRVGCMYALFQSIFQWLHCDVTRQTVIFLRFKCVLAQIASMVMVSAFKSD
jgi:hypothetical protein